MSLGSLTSSPEPKVEPAQIISQAKIASLSETIKNNPDNPQAYNMRGSVLAQAGGTDEALADFINKAISDDPSCGPTFARVGAGPDYETFQNGFSGSAGVKQRRA